MKFISANVNAGLRTVPGTQQTLYVFVVGILVIIITITYFNVVLSALHSFLLPSQRILLNQIFSKIFTMVPSQYFKLSSIM